MSHDEAPPELDPRKRAKMEGASQATRWYKQWVQQDTLLNSGKCQLLKWVSEAQLLAAQAAVAEDAGRVAVIEPEEQEIVYVCTSEGCGKVFSEAAALRKHAHVHGEKQFVCHYEGCGKRFVDSSKLKRHFLIHTGEKHFVCPFEGCGKAFSLDFNLRSHMRTHTGENYHTCPFEDCGKRYAHEYKLRAHIKAHHGKEMAQSPMSSEKEAFGFAGPTPEPAPATSQEGATHECPFEDCGKRYLHEYKLNMHLKKEHDSRDEFLVNAPGGDTGATLLTKLPAYNS